MATTASLPSCEPCKGACVRATRVLVVHRFPVIRFGVMKLAEEHLPEIVTAGTRTVSRAARRCFAAGAAGFVTSDSSRTELVDAIQTVMSGVRYLSPRVIETIGATPSSRGVRPGTRLLCDQELEVMRLLAWGKSVDEIALLLAMTARAVRAALGRIIR
jgi:DNA-binding NarL/FixJ family response regulator